MLEIVVSILLLTGSFFILVGAIGMTRLPDFFMRLHGPTKATTLGVGSMLAASIIHPPTGAFGLHEFLVVLFLFVTAPLSAHLLAKAALHLRLRSTARVPDPLPGTRSDAE